MYMTIQYTEESVADWTPRSMGQHHLPGEEKAMLESTLATAFMYDQTWKEFQKWQARGS